MRRLAPLVVLAFAACADTVTEPTAEPNLARIHEAEGSHGGTPFMAVLIPSEEPPRPGVNEPHGGDPSSDASGVIFLTLNSGQEEICFKTTFSGLSEPVNAAHIHRSAGAAGPIVVPLDVPAWPSVKAGTVAQCVPASRELIKEIRKNPEAFYVNIHTQSTPPNGVDARPRGAIRGDLTKTQGSNVNHG